MAGTSDDRSSSSKADHQLYAPSSSVRSGSVVTGNKLETTEGVTVTLVKGSLIQQEVNYCTVSLLRSCEIT